VFFIKEFLPHERCQAQIVGDSEKPFYKYQTPGESFRVFYLKISRVAFNSFQRERGYSSVPRIH